MKRRTEELVIMIGKSGTGLLSRIPLTGINRVVVVYNRQFTNAPNTTQIASGAGRSSAAGSNAAIRSPYTYQQQSVGAGGKAGNIGPRLFAKPSAAGKAPGMAPPQSRGKEVVIIVNDQIAKLSRRSLQAAATQIASGGGAYSTGGTNSAIGSAGTKQQHAVGGGSGSIGANKLAGAAKRRRRS